MKASFFYKLIWETPTEAFWSASSDLGHTVDPIAGEEFDPVEA